jgi:hypothetical protein
LNAQTCAGAFEQTKRVSLFTACFSGDVDKRLDGHVEWADAIGQLIV